MVDRKYTAEELVSDGVSKKDIVNELHGKSSAAWKFLVKELKVRVAFLPVPLRFFTSISKHSSIFSESLPLFLVLGEK